MEVRALTQPKKESAIRLARTVFLEFEAPEYPAEGAQDFFRFIDDPEVVEGLAMYGVYLGGALTGMIATRSGGTHISLFFVDKRYHRMGIGRKLFEAALSRCPADAFVALRGGHIPKIRFSWHRRGTDGRWHPLHSNAL